MIKTSEKIMFLKHIYYIGTDHGYMESVNYEEFDEIISEVFSDFNVVYLETDFAFFMNVKKEDT